MIELADLHQRTVLGGMLDADLEAQPDTAHALPAGTRLLDYEIVRLIGEGGFGIVYLAWDRVTKQHVAIKEYLPSVLASRATTSQLVILKSRRHAEHFRSGLRSFMYEARLLARFNHPSLVKVLRFWELNGTAYMAMPYHEGPTLGAVLENLGRPANEQELRGWLTPLLDALRSMHAVSCYHRDISPDNILLTADAPMLLDFGAARRVIGNMSQAPTVMVKPGFAPIEQYGDVASMKQGPWSDLYALAAVVYTAVTGSTPVASISRLAGEHLEPLAELAAGHYSASLLRTVDEALAVFPENRPQSVADFQARMDAEDPAPFMAAASALDATEPSLSPGDEAEGDGDGDGVVAEGDAPSGDLVLENARPGPSSAQEPAQPPLQLEQAQEQEPEPGSPQPEEQAQGADSAPVPSGGVVHPVERQAAEQEPAEQEPAAQQPAASAVSAKLPRADASAARPSTVGAAHSLRFRRKAIAGVAMLVVLVVAGGASYLIGPSDPVASVASSPAPKPSAATLPAAMAKKDAVATPEAIASAAPSSAAAAALSRPSPNTLRPAPAAPAVAQAPGAAADAARPAPVKAPAAPPPGPIAVRPRADTSPQAEGTGVAAPAPAAVATTASATPSEVLPGRNPPLVVASGGERLEKDEVRCNDMVQRASLEPISAGHARRLKQECQK